MEKTIESNEIQKKQKVSGLVERLVMWFRRIMTGEKKGVAGIEDRRWEEAMKESAALEEANYIIERAIDEQCFRDMRNEARGNREFHVSATEFDLLSLCGKGFSEMLDGAKVVVTT